MIFTDLKVRNKSFLLKNAETKILTYNPVRYYKLDDLSGTTCKDYSKFLLNGTYQNTITYRQVGPFSYMPSVRFTNTTGAVAEGSQSGVDMGLLCMDHFKNGFTGMFFANDASTLAGATGSMQIAIGNTSGTTDEIIMYRPSGNWGSVISKNSSNYKYNSNGVIGNTWLHIATTITTGTNPTINNYINGCLCTVGSVTGTVGTLAQADNWSDVRSRAYIGKSWHNLAVYLGTNGNMSEVALINNMLTSKNILDIYNAYSYYAYTITQDSPFLYFRMGERATAVVNDSSSNALNATYITTPTQFATGLLVDDIDKCATFNGTTHYATLTHTSTIQPTTAMSIECIIKPSSTSGNKYIVSKRETGTNTGYYLQINAGALEFGVGTSLGASFSTVSSSTGIATGTVNHAIATFDGQYLRLYSNGIKVAETDLGSTYTIDANTTNLHIGRDVATGTNYYAGDLDELSIYSTALDENKISKHYSAKEGL